MRKQYTRVQYNAQGQKQCTKCQVYKNTSDFHKYAKAQDGLKPWCKPCVKEYDIVENDPKRKMPRKLDADGKIHCRNCGEYFDEESMVKSKNGKYKGLTYCKECSPLLDRIRAIKNYGISVEHYHEMLAEQNYSCKICGMHETQSRVRMSIDHDHTCCPGTKSCGKCVRGLLCSSCNMFLGSAKDNIENLKRAILYLEGKL